MRVLLATLGGSWQVVPELYGFTNPEDLPLYAASPEAAALDQERQRHGLEPANAIWLATTAGQARELEPTLHAWAEAAGGVAMRVWWPEGMEDIRSGEDARRMGELLYRLAWHASRAGSPPVLGIAGGRKTMSADLQQAGEAFGWGALLHVVDRFEVGQAGRVRGLPTQAFARPLEGEWAGVFRPVVVAAARPPSEAVEAEHEALAEKAGTLPEPGPVALPAAPLRDAVEGLASRGAGLVANYRLQLSAKEPTGSFRALYALSAQVVKALRHERIGADPGAREQDLAWLRRLPKAELHCHLGGVLSTAEMVTVAAGEAARVREARRRHPGFDADLRRVEAWCRAEALGELCAFVSPLGMRGLRTRWHEVPEPLGVCGFLQAFHGREHLLDALVFGELRDPRRFQGIGIDAYERLGDLQGSGLLQSEATLRGALGCLRQRCREDGVRYLELRCSPANYTRGGLSAEQVVEVLVDAAEAMAEDCDMRLLFIASRHGELERAREHVRLATGLLDGPFKRHFAGFDLAGAEHVGRTGAFRDIFRPLHEQVVPITIHAGEDQDPQNIWEAVYELAADRVGHGLTLRKRPHLLDRFRDRRIALEMCPSSNYQIVGYRDHLLGSGGDHAYPLREYLDAGLHVTVNTDDPGMSRTTLSEEYLKAAAMTEGGLSRWDILRILRNGLRAAFCSHEDRRRLLERAEGELTEMAKAGTLA